MNIDPSTALLVGLLLAIAFAGAAWSYSRQPRHRWLDDVSLRRIIVHTRDGQSLEGHLAQTMDDGISLAGAKLVSDDPPKPIAGEVHVHRDRIAWVQTHPESG